MGILPPNTIPPTGNGSVITSQTVAEAMSPQQETTDSFQRNLEAGQKTIQDQLLHYPLDLFQSPEYLFGIKFDIYDASGDVLAENRKITNNITEMVNSASQAMQDAKNEAVENKDVGVGAEAKVVVSGLVSAAASLGGVALNEAGKIFQAIKTTPQKYDPNGRDSFVDSVVGVKSPMKLVSTVYMYLPGQLSYLSSFDYEDADMSGIDFIRSLQGAAGIGDPTAQGEAIRRMGVGAIQTLDNLGDMVGGKDMIQNFAKIQTRQTENPFLVHLFKGVQRRSFKFEFTMVPRSEMEARNVNAIIQTFRKYAHPARSPGGRFLDFPAEFDLSFIYNNNGNPGEYLAVPKIAKCAIKSVSVDYGENIFSAHLPKQDPMGRVQPTTIKMSLELSELSILARQEIERGY